MRSAIEPLPFPTRLVSVLRQILGAPWRVSRSVYCVEQSADARPSYVRDQCPRGLYDRTSLLHSRCYYFAGCRPPRLRPRRARCADPRSRDSGNWRPNSERPLEHQCDRGLVEPNRRLLAGQLLERDGIRDLALVGRRCVHETLGYGRRRHDVRRWWSRRARAVLLPGPCASDLRQQDQLFAIFQHRLHEHARPSATSSAAAALHSSSCAHVARGVCVALGVDDLVVGQLR